MINVSNEIKQAYDISTTQVDRIILNNTKYRISNVEYYDDVYNDGNIFGTAIARCLDFEIENDVNLEKQEVEYQTGIIINGITQWISLGNFIIQDIDSNDTTNISKVSAIDYMLKLNIPYKSGLPYQDNNVTLLQVAQEACNLSGLKLATIDFANKDFIVDSNQFSEGTINRQVIQAIAQISGTVAKIKNDNKLYFINPNEITTISKVFTLNNYEEAEIKRNTHPINAVSLAMENVEGENITLIDEESISKNGKNDLVINDNPFAYTQAKREQLITALFDAVKGFEYKSYSFKCQGLFYLETMDKVQFKDKTGNVYNSYVFRFNCKSPNGLESTIEAPSIIKATIEYQNTPDALDIAKRTEYIVNKQEQTIKQLIQETSENEEKITQVEQDVDSFTEKVMTKDEITEQINELKHTIEGITLESKRTGGDNIFYYSKEYWRGEEENSSPALEELTNTNIKQNTISGMGYILNNGKSIQSQVVKNGYYTISFKYFKMIDLAIGSITINNISYSLDAENLNQWYEMVIPLEVTTNSIIIEINTDTNSSYWFSDLMVAVGTEQKVWSQNANETRTDNVKIGKGIQVESSSSNTYTRIDADGNRTYNKTTNERVAEMTDKGVYANELEVKKQAKINILLIQEISGQAWITGIGG